MKSSSRSVWDVLVMRPDGEWVGFRTPLKSLRAAGNYFGIVLIFFALSFAGFLLSRWRVVELQRSLHEQILLTQSLRASQTQGVVASFSESSTTSSGQLSGSDMSSPVIGVDQIRANYDRAKQSLKIDFRLRRGSSVVGLESYRWILVLHTSGQLMTLPSALDLQNRHLLALDRAALVKEVKIDRRVSAEFQVGDFFETQRTQPVNVHLLVYHANGTLLVRQSVGLERASP